MKGKAGNYMVGRRCVYRYPIIQCDQKGDKIRIVKIMLEKQLFNAKKKLFSEMKNP